MNFSKIMIDAAKSEGSIEWINFFSKGLEADFDTTGNPDIQSCKKSNYAFAKSLQY